MATLTCYKSFEDLKSSKNSLHAAKKEPLKETELKELVNFIKAHHHPKEQIQANNSPNKSRNGK